MNKILPLLILLLAFFSTNYGLEVKAYNDAEVVISSVPSDVEELSIEGVNNGQVTRLDTLVDFPQLSVLTLKNTGKGFIRSYQLDEIAHVTTLKELTLNTKVEVEEGMNFAGFDAHPSLEKLHFEQDYQDPQWGKIPNPKGPSNVYGCVVKPKYKRSPTNYIEGLAHIPQLKELSILHFSAVGPWHFEALQSLESLTLLEPDWHKEGAEQFKESVLPQLKKFDMKGYQQQKTCYRLKDPDLRGIDFYHVAPSLEYLSLVKTQVTDAEMESLAHSTTLKYINLSQTGVTKDVLLPLAQIATLEEIHLNNITMKGADYTVLANLPNLKILSVRSSMNLEDVMTLIPLDAQLEELHLSKGLDPMIVNYVKSNMPTTKVIAK